MSEYEELRAAIKDAVDCYTRTSDDTEALTDELLSIIADKCWLKVEDWTPLTGEAWQPIKEIKKDE